MAASIESLENEFRLNNDLKKTFKDFEINSEQSKAELARLKHPDGLDSVKDNAASMQGTFESVNKIQVMSLVNLHTQVLKPLRLFEAIIKEAIAAIRRVKKV